jgi:uncharacterized UPF0160 family protein
MIVSKKKNQERQMAKLIATHNKVFHADEVSAIALLQIFVDEDLEVCRVDHDTKDFDKFDMVIDVGRVFDGEKFFDHHQYKGGKSSAGLIWDYIGLQDKYPKISKLVKLIDDNDTGVAKAREFEYSSLLKAFNHKDIASKEQDEAFWKAVDFAKTIFRSLRDSQEALKEAKTIVANSYIFDRNMKIMELERFTPHWTSHINGELTPNIKAVVWEDEIENNYKVKIVPKRVGSFELVTKPFPQDKMMEFVHSAGHFAIAKDEETMKKFLRKYIKN